MTRTEAYEHVTALIAEACREDESMSLAGIGPEELLSDEERAAGNPAPLVGIAALEAGVRDALAEIEKVRTHAHVWDYGNSESDPVRCRVCGADGLA